MVTRWSLYALVFLLRSMDFIPPLGILPPSANSDPSVLVMRCVGHMILLHKLMDSLQTFTLINSRKIRPAGVTASAGTGLRQGLFSWFISLFSPTSEVYNQIAVIPPFTSSWVRFPPLPNVFDCSFSKKSRFSDSELYGGQQNSRPRYPFSTWCVPCTFNV